MLRWRAMSTRAATRSRRAFLLGGDELLARRQNGPPRRLSLDEAHHRRGRELATVVCDLDRRRVIDVVLDAPEGDRKLADSTAGRGARWDRGRLDRPF